MLGFAEHPWCHPAALRAAVMTALREACIRSGRSRVVGALATSFHFTGRAARESAVSQGSDAAAAGAARADRELLDSLAHDPSALEVLYDRYVGLVYGLALAALRSPDDAQDLTQEIFLSLYRQANAYDPARGALAGFLATTTRTRAIDRLRARTRKVRLLHHFQHRVPVAAQPFTALERISIAQRSERVRAALAQLPGDQRRVLEMAYYRGLSQSEIAADLDASLGTVKSWARRGLIALRHTLGDLLE
jgi:RNA polymerase sigma-70 factor, ECF subfamily